MSALVQLRGVGKSFGALQALAALDLTLERGATTILIGSSGCGKSTVLRLIVGLEEADAGALEFDGEAITPDRIDTLRRRLGYVIQDGGLFPHLTARENITIQARFLREPANEIEQRLHELAALAHFPENALDRYPLELSGGQRQRVSLMRALMLAPELLLLDEPFAALDPLVRAKLRGDLKEICARLQQTVLLVTHDLAEAAFFGGEIVLMRDGRVVQRGLLAELNQTPADPFVTEFLNAQRSAAPL